MQRLLRILMVALVLPLALPERAAAADPTLLFSYEVTGAYGLDLPKLPEATYAERATFAGEVLDKLVPDVIRATGIDPRKVETQITPGGYLLKTNASLQSKLPLGPQ